MKQSVPWSVKGVEADARETAKELARRSGMTLGQWLNAMITEQTAEADAAPSEIAAPAASSGSARDIAADAGSESAAAERLSPLDALAQRLEMMNRRSTETARAPKSEDHRAAEAAFALD